MSSRDDAIRFRHRAEELRRLADSTKDQKIREGLENWAKEYDRKAEQAESQQTG